MSYKLSRSISNLVCYTFFILSAILINPSHAGTWTEEGDAGELLPSSQEPKGSGSLDTITGTITNSDDHDVYKIFISNPSEFSAITFNGWDEANNGWDARLMLFNDKGIGVYSNDDITENVNRNARLPSNHPIGPQTAGTYYLAISDDDSHALSSNSIEDLIFPRQSPPYIQIAGPTGEGGSLPLFAWASVEVFVTFNANYGINLTGARFVKSVPAAVLLFDYLLD